MRGLLVLVLLTVPTAVQSQFKYTVNADNTLTITGYTGVGGAVTIPSNIDGLTVTSIGNSAFENAASLSSIAIPNGVTNIGDSAFDYCTSLASVTIGSSVRSIGDSAFASTGLTSVTIPGNVTSIGGSAFWECDGLTSVTIPGSVTNLGELAFAFCTGLTSVFFTGNAPTADSSVFLPGDNATVYYLPDRTGWSSPFAGRPALLWNPLCQASGASFGVQSNQFGFNVTGTAYIPILVETCTNLTSSVWTPLQTLTLTNGLFYFSEPVQTNIAGRFYRIRSP